MKQHRYDEAIEILRKQGMTRDDARETLKMAREGSVSSIQYTGGTYAFKRAVGPNTDDLEAFDGCSAQYTIAGNEYVFNYDGRNVSVDRNRLRTFIVSYVNDGIGTDFIAACRRAGIPESTGNLVRKALGITKTYPPFLPDEYNNLADDTIVDELQANRYARLKAREERLNVRRTAREVQSYRNKDAWLQARLDAISNIDLLGMNRTEIPRANTGLTAFVGTHDLHFGKRQFNGTNEWDNQPLINAIDNICADIELRGCDNIVTVFGSDMFNVDNVDMTTTRGTKQRNLATMGEMADAAMEYFVYAVNELSRVASTAVYVVAGNHDRSLVNFAGSLLSRVFASNPNVAIIYSDTVRQYHACGDTLVCLHHGDIRVKDLESVARVEGAEIYDRVFKRLIIMQGHYHKFSLDTHGNTVYTTASSGGPQDQWEYENFGKSLDRLITTYYVRESGPIVGVEFEEVV